MDLISIGEFARLSRLSPKALRLYDDLGLLPPARVDPDSGYRWYETGQLERARLVASLRQIGLPLAQIKGIVDLPAKEAADEIARYWAAAESDHDARRELANHLVDRLNGKKSAVFEVAVREIPARRVLCLQRNVADQAGVVALGKECIALFRDKAVLSLEGIAGSAFLIYHGEVSEDSDGPVEWCRPVPDDQADRIAATFPGLELRTEPAHREAFVHLGTAQLTAAQWQLVSETLHAWGADHGQLPSELGVRVTFTAPPVVTADSRPDCDFAVPLRDDTVPTATDR
jgi:DNA-binding transcriptional MerR regulator